MAARICREAGARVVPNMLVRNMDLVVPVAGDARRLEVVADGLPLGRGPTSSRHDFGVSSASDRNPRRGAATRDGVALSEARRDKERTYPELVGGGARARLVVLALEVGGRWSPEATDFVSQLAKAKARSEPFLVRRRIAGMAVAVDRALGVRSHAVLRCLLVGSPRRSGRRRVCTKVT